MARQSLIHFCFFLPILSALLLIGCRPGPGAGEETLPSKKPLALIYESRIAGNVIGQSLSGPIGMVSDDAGHLYVVDAG
ncbi:MAG: hypothetical protein AB1746_09360, partial [Candidatus Zixiibacteriota bacterium]